MTTLARDLFHVLSHAEHHATRALAAALSANGSSVEQWRVLALLAAGDGQPMTAVADHALLPPPTATKLVDRMVAANLVYRRADPADRRRVLVYATERGQALHRHLAAAVARLQDELLHDIADTGDLTDTLARLARSLAPGTQDHPEQVR